MVVGIVCHELLYREALESLLRTQTWVEVLPSSPEPRVALSQFAKQTPDIVVIVEEGVTEEEWSMFAALKTLMGVRGLLLTKLGAPASRNELPVDAALRREDGAATLFQLLRDVTKRTVRQGLAVAEMGSRYGQRPTLTARELEVANLVAQGLPNRRIGVIMGLQEQSVKNLVSIVMRKLNCENRVQVALKLSGALRAPTSTTPTATEE
jgi:DNA-binding NarL/FixJ family response regulator